MIEWRKSSRSQGNAQGNCVEVSTNASAVTLIQDSKAPGPHLTLTPADLAAFVARIKSGNLDL
ncbi:hypothetical protein GCM10022221_08850 [Actinocorallia aurea]